MITRTWTAQGTDISTKGDQPRRKHLNWPRREVPKRSVQPTVVLFPRNSCYPAPEMHYSIIGPGNIARDEHGSICGRQPELWDDFEDQCDGVSEGCGCYIFAIRAGKGLKPWYVGKAEKQPFRRECFTPHKLSIYRNLMYRYRSGTPVLFLVVRETPTGRICKPADGYRDVEFLETMIIGQALRANSEICNIKDTRLLRDMTVPGMLNGRQGKPTRSVSAFKRLLNLR